MANMKNTDEIFESLRMELRRGSLTLAVLAQLKTEQYGYVLRKSLSDQGLEIDENTLYPLLRRLETQGLLASQWREEEKRNKRFYRLSPQGEVILYQLLNEHEIITGALDRIVLRGQRGNESPEERKAVETKGPALDEVLQAKE